MKTANNKRIDKTTEKFWKYHTTKYPNEINIWRRLIKKATKKYKLTYWANQRAILKKSSSPSSWSSWYVAMLSLWVVCAGECLLLNREYLERLKKALIPLARPSSKYHNMSLKLTKKKHGHIIIIRHVQDTHTQWHLQKYVINLGLV